MSIDDQLPHTLTTHSYTTPVNYTLPHHMYSDQRTIYILHTTHYTLHTTHHTPHTHTYTPPLCSGPFQKPVQRVVWPTCATSSANPPMLLPPAATHSPRSYAHTVQHSCTRRAALMHHPAAFMHPPWLIHAAFQQREQRPSCVHMNGPVAEELRMCGWGPCARQASVWEVCCWYSGVINMS